MSRKGPIILIDDDEDEHEFVALACKELGMKNEIISFTMCEDAFLHLMDTINQSPYIIICDVNMPAMTGLDLKKKIDTTFILRQKSIPFVFWSTSISRDEVNFAFQHSVQGYFRKPATPKDIKETLRMIFDYWKVSEHPHV
jgi:CheY-like chemotaxis protein